MKMIITIVMHKVLNYLCEHSFLQEKNKKYFVDKNALNNMKNLTKIKMYSNKPKLMILLAIFPIMVEKTEDSCYLKRLGYFGISMHKAKFFICGETHTNIHVSNIEKFIAECTIDEIQHSIQKSERLCIIFSNSQTQNTMTNNRNQIPYRQDDRK
jgi:hypothetical protein